MKLIKTISTTYENNWQEYMNIFTGHSSPKWGSLKDFTGLYIRQRTYLYKRSYFLLIINYPTPLILEDLRTDFIIDSNI